MSSQRIYPPGPKAMPILGHIPELRNRRLDFFIESAKTYGETVHLRIGPGVHAYMLNHPDSIHQVLIGQPEAFHKTPALRRISRESIGNGLLSSDGEFHKRQRRLAQPAFHMSRITAYADTMTHFSERLMQRWADGQTIPMTREMMKLTLDIVAKTLFDADVSGQADAIGHAITVGLEYFNKAVTSPVRAPRWWPTRTQRERRAAEDTVESTMMGIINERRASGEDRGDLLSMLLLAVDEDDGGQMTNQQVRDEAMTLFIAGHETTANALAWTWALLASHPEAEAKFHDELDTVLGGRTPTLADLSRLPYLDMVLKESIRLYPPAWFFSRQAIEDVEIGGYAVAKGSLVMVSPYVMHRHPDYFEQPERFWPERWADGLEKQLPKCVYFPFGGGPRVCIGQSFAQMEARLALATIGQKVQFRMQGAFPEMDPLITLRPKGDLPMQVVMRQPVASGEHQPVMTQA